MVEQMLSWLALDLHTPPEALEYSSRLGGGSSIMLLALSENQLTVWADRKLMHSRSA